MSLKFKLTSDIFLNDVKDSNVGYLCVNTWDDFGIKSKFTLNIFDENGIKHNLGNVKIGKVGFINGWIRDELDPEFTTLNEQFFSLGQDASYYSELRNLSPTLADNILSALNDIVFKREIFDAVMDEKGLQESLLRSVSTTSIKGQYTRVLNGEALRTSFKFRYKKDQSEECAGVDLLFNVTPDSTPSTNLHVLIGRNGVGKTTIINDIVSSIIIKDSRVSDVGGVYDLDDFLDDTRIVNDYFSSVTSVSFSAFDPFQPPQNRADRTQGTCYFYIGLKKNSNNANSSSIKGHQELQEDFVNSIVNCFSLDVKRSRWVKAIKTLESDTNFAEMNLTYLAGIDEEERLRRLAYKVVPKMSSGHTIVLLTITKLIETIEEKTLVLLDEPESHLHPPLLSAFTRALSDLLIERNAVAIVATHSPVVLQEVPRSCVWKLDRSRLVGNSFRPEAETFGENVGLLTREVFGLETIKSGFHDLLVKSVEDGLGYEQILDLYSNQLGFEGKSILRALLANKDEPEL